MAPLEGVGDRRRHVRFEILGDLWASLTTTESVRLLDLGPGGVLVELVDPPVVGSHLPVRLTLGEDVLDFSAVVRHVKPAPSRPNRYLVGMAVEPLSPDCQKRIHAFMSGGGANAGGREA